VPPNQRLHLSGAVFLKEAVQLWTRILIRPQVKRGR